MGGAAGARRWSQPGCPATWIVPIPSGGAQAALSGAPITYIVGEALKSQWTIVVPKASTASRISKARRSAMAGRQRRLRRGAIVLQRFFRMEPGKDYKIISFQVSQDRIGALVNGDIQGALVSVPHAAEQWPWA
jgi:hypothetical protein